MKYIGLDFGEKKVGLAHSDDDGRVAFPLMVSANDSKLLKEMKELIRELKVGTLVIGESVDAHGKPNPIAKKARAFAAQIEAELDIRIVFEKEWYSTVEARKQPGKSGQHDVDDSAAAIILQRHLDRVNGPGEYKEDDGEEGGDGDEGNDSW